MLCPDPLTAQGLWYEQQLYEQPPERGSSPQATKEARVFLGPYKHRDRADAGRPKKHLVVDKQGYSQHVAFLRGWLVGQLDPIGW